MYKEIREDHDKLKFNCGSKNATKTNYNKIYLNE